MSPLCRRWLALLLVCALPGAPFAEPPRSSQRQGVASHPYDATKDKTFDSYTHQTYAALGFTYQNGQLINKDGKALSQEEKRRMDAPADVADIPLPRGYAERLKEYGYEVRVIDGKRRIVSVESGDISTVGEVLSGVAMFNKGEVPPGGEVYKVPAGAEGEQTKAVLLNAGFKAGADGTVLDSKGRPLTQADLARLYAPVRPGSNKVYEAAMKAWGLEEQERPGGKVLVMAPSPEPATGLAVLMTLRNLGLETVGPDDLDKPYSLPSRYDQSFRQALARLGYRVDEKSGAMSKDGKAVTAAEYIRLNAPYNEKEGKLPERLFVDAGLRRVEKDGKTLIYQQNATQPMTVLAATLAGKDVRNLRTAMGRMSLLLEKKDPNARLSSEDLKELRRLAGSSGGAIPESVERALAAGEAMTAGQLRGAVEQAALSAERYWDGAKSFGQLTAAVADPATTTLDIRDQARKQFVAEMPLHEKLQVGIIAHFADSKVGTERLEQFRKNGKLELPTFRVVSGRFPAFYTREYDAVAIGFEEVQRRMPTVLEALAGKDEKTRAAYKAALQDERKFNTLLLNDPKAVREFIKEFDSEILHETTHAWQARRDPSSIEAIRGNTVSMNRFEDEHEAWLTEARLFHEKLLDPAKRDRAIKNSRHMHNYAEMIKDFDRWRDHVGQNYASLGARAGSLKTVGEMQDWRMRLAAKSGEQGWLEAGRALLKLAGMTRGKAALNEDSEYYKKTFADFRSKEWVRMRVEGFGPLAGAYLSKNRKSMALGTLQEQIAFLERGRRRGVEGISKPMIVAAREKAESIAHEQIAALLAKDEKGVRRVDALDAHSGEFHVRALKSYYDSRILSPAAGIHKLDPPPAGLEELYERFGLGGSR